MCKVSEEKETQVYNNNIGIPTRKLSAYTAINSHKETLKIPIASYPNWHKVVEYEGITPSNFARSLNRYTSKKVHQTAIRKRQAHYKKPNIKRQQMPQEVDFKQDFHSDSLTVRKLFENLNKWGIEKVLFESKLEHFQRITKTEEVELRQKINELNAISESFSKDTQFVTGDGDVIDHEIDITILMLTAEGCTALAYDHDYNRLFKMTLNANEAKRFRKRVTHLSRSQEVKKAIKSRGTPPHWSIKTKLTKVEGQRYLALAKDTLLSETKHNEIVLELERLDGY
jgi:hypothetical protein